MEHGPAGDRVEDFGRSYPNREPLPAAGTTAVQDVGSVPITAYSCQFSAPMFTGECGLIKENSEDAEDRSKTAQDGPRPPP